MHNRVSQDAPFAAGVSVPPTLSTVSLVALILLLVGSLIFSIGLGALHISPTQTLAILLHRLGIVLPLTEPYTAQQEAVLLTMRLPRAALCILVGSALSTSGASLQGLFRNPLADPGLMGVSSGAALAAVGATVLGRSHMNQELTTWGVPLAALLGALITIALVYQLSHLRGKTLVTTMILAGIAVNALTGAALGYLTFTADTAQLRSLTFWSLGGLGQATWQTVAATAPFTLVACLVLPRLARPLNAMLLGEAEAVHLGFDSERTKLGVIGLAAMAVGASVAATGVISFLGLIGPHLARLLLGADHRVLLPGSALLGGSLLLMADLLARTLASPAEVPVGIMTALLGAPFFLWLLLHERSRVGL